MANLSYGSRGEDVRALQEQLRAAGYNIAADGIFGPATQNAVRAYQQANGLQVDGIVGNQTRSALSGGSAAQTAYTPAAAPAPSTNIYSGGSAKQEYDPNTDAAYQAAMAALDEVKGRAPTYTGSYDTQLDELYSRIVDRDKFRYDVNGDELYRQYADQYTRMGRQAMEDTIGKTAGLTGGYGSTYGQSAGQQAYNAYLAQLGNVVPELEQRAYDRYMDEGNELLAQYEMLGQRADDEYSKYMDSYNQWLADRDAAQTESDAAWERAYQLFRDSVSDSQWERQFAASQAAKAQSASSSPASSTERQTVSAPTITRNKNEESATGSGVTGFSNVKRTISSALYLGQEMKALDLVDGIWNQATASQRKELKKVLSDYGYAIKE